MSLTHRGNELYATPDIPECDIISSLPVDITFSITTMNPYLRDQDGELMQAFEYMRSDPNYWLEYNRIGYNAFGPIFTELIGNLNGVNTTQSSGTNIGNGGWRSSNTGNEISVFVPNYILTLNNSTKAYNIFIQLKGKELYYDDPPPKRTIFTFSVQTRTYNYTFNKLPNNYALPQFNYYIEGLDTKVNFSVEVKQYINPVPNTYNIGDIASDSNNNYWIVARDNTGSSVWKSINIRDLYSSSLVYDLGDLIVNPDDSIDVMYRTDNNIWKRIGTLKI